MPRCGTGPCGSCQCSGLFQAGHELSCERRSGQAPQGDACCSFLHTCCSGSRQKWCTWGLLRPQSDWSGCSSGKGMLKFAWWASRSGMCPSSWKAAAQQRARKARRPDCERQPLSLLMTRTSMRWRSHPMMPSSALHHKTALPRQHLFPVPVLPAD